MNIILFGPPGSGKGTQAEKLSKEFNFLKVSSGDLLRNEIAKNNSLGNKIKKIVEKPKNSKSNLAITGLYLFDKNVSDYSKKIKMSKRKETEIVDLINIYNKKNKLKITDLGRGGTWLDTGTIESLLAASTYVQVVEERQKYKIASLEEIALLKKWINKKNIINFQ